MIQRILHIKCDYCGAEGPTLVGERRKELLSAVKKLGWQLLDNNTHKCMECVKPKVTQTVRGIVVDHAAPDHDRSVHWTESRKRSE